MADGPQADDVSAALSSQRRRWKSQLDRLRAIALALPEATEELTWETSINFRVRNKIFLFPGSGDQVMVKADREELPALLGDPRFRPAPYLARGGWVVLDISGAPDGASEGVDVDWDEVTELVHTSYCLIAPKRLAAQVGASVGAPGKDQPSRR